MTWIYIWTKQNPGTSIKIAENSVTMYHHPFGPLLAGMERQIASASHDVGAKGKQARLGVEAVKSRFSKSKGKRTHQA